MFADKMLGSLNLHVVSPLSGVFTIQSVDNRNSGAPESGYAQKLGLDKKPEYVG
jgi:hypothetical protein